MKAEIGSLVAIANMTTTERIEHSIQQDDDFKKQVKRTNIFLLLIAFALFAGPALLAGGLHARYRLCKRSLSRTCT